ncbi:hypothetical protein Pla175_15070 [Pirellulimonas nuda]|uniref:HAMP domain-containing protein n=1 Tax=Pirellulimonas nuda TaxID=2528009 RepID=A0A518D9N2_9BACT|nr:hypothetical protein [Pirellulimonas nuda]QDU88136.1 hypothetical protein Pla175_15070 [Pirellulimonas nuda]
MKKNRKFRARLLVDRKLQGALLCRVVTYWCVCVAAMMLLAGVQAALSSREAGWPLVINRAMLAFGPSLIAAMVLLPLVLYDALRFSLSFAGPMRRLRSEARRLADGERVAPITFRGGDYWFELAGEFNRISAELSRLREEQSSHAAPAEPSPGAAETAGRS